jgi:hypothetical protein
MSKIGSGAFTLLEWLQKFYSSQSKSNPTRKNTAVSYSMPTLKTDSFSLSTDALVSQQWVKDLYLHRFYGNGNLDLAKSRSIRQCGGGFYLDSSPSGRYVQIAFGKTYVAISSEAYAAMQKTRYTEFQTMMKSGESIKSVFTYEEYSEFCRLQYSAPSRDEYNYLCLSKKEKDTLKADAIALCERWGNGEDVTNAQFAALCKYDYAAAYSGEPSWADHQSKAYNKRKEQERSDLLSEAFAQNGVYFDEGESFEIKYFQDATFTVTGIEDDEKRQKVLEALKNTVGATSWEATFTNYTPLLGGGTSSRYSFDDERTSKIVGATEKYLRENFDGVKLTDLYIDARGNIAGGLPKETLDKINNAAAITFDKDFDYYKTEEHKWSIIKQNMEESLRLVKKHGYENLPRVSFDFVYSNGQLTMKK